MEILRNIEWSRKKAPIIRKIIYNVFTINLKEMFFKKRSGMNKIHRKIEWALQLFEKW